MSIEKNTPNFLKHCGLGFTTIINQTMDLIHDAAALGIYCYLASKPNNWKICNTELAKRFGKGRDHIIKKMAILKEIGLVKTKPNRNERGEIISWETTLLKQPETNNAENQYCGKKQSQNTKKPQNTENQYSSKQVIENNEEKLSTGSRILKTQNLDNPESGKTDTNNKRIIKNKSAFKNKRKNKSFCKIENEKKHDFAENMNQIARESEVIKENETFKRTPMPEKLRQMCKSLTAYQNRDSSATTRRKSYGCGLNRETDGRKTEGERQTIQDERGRS